MSVIKWGRAPWPLWVYLAIGLVAVVGNEIQKSTRASLVVPVVPVAGAALVRIREQSFGRALSRSGEPYVHFKPAKKRISELTRKECSRNYQCNIGFGIAVVGRRTRSPASRKSLSGIERDLIQLKNRSTATGLVWRRGFTVRSTISEC
jgi:hypothetical protein